MRDRHDPPNDDRPGGAARPPTAHLTVGEVARRARVSVRTLHHYDALGLVSPGERGENGYRRYTRTDLERLQRVLAYRALGFGLDAIRALLDDPNLDATEHLRRQAALLDRRAERLDAMRRAVRTHLEARQMGIDLDPNEMLEVFGDEDPGQYAAEAEERWGGTDAYRQSRERARRYRKEDWQRMKEDMEAIERSLADALAAGEPATGKAAMDAAEAHRRHIAQWFYDCDHAMHLGLGEMYLADERFTRHYDDRAPGLAAYVAAAIRANAARHGHAPEPGSGPAAG